MSKEMGRWLSKQVISPFLKRDITRASYNLVGNIPVKSDWFMTIRNTGVRTLVKGLIIFNEILSTPALDLNWISLKTLVISVSSTGLKKNVAWEFFASIDHDLILHYGVLSCLLLYLQSDYWTIQWSVWDHMPPMKSQKLVVHS